MTEKITAIVKWVTKEMKPVGEQYQIAFNSEEGGDKLWYNVYGSKEGLEKMKEEMVVSGNEISFIYEMNNASEFTLIKKGEPKKSFGFKEDPKAKIAGMIISYVKDLVVAEKIALIDFEEQARRLKKLHSELSK